MGDQFIALSEGRSQSPDDGRHFGVVVDDRSDVRELAAKAGAMMIEGPYLDFLDPGGNRVEVVQYRDVQFTKSAAVLEAMELSLDKSERAKGDLKKRGIRTSVI
jgi:hypothetical protein